MLVSSKSLQPAPRTPCLHEMDAATFPWEGPCFLSGSMEAGSPLLCFHVIQPLACFCCVRETQPVSEALAASSKLRKQSFIMNEGDLLSGGPGAKPNCAAALSHPHTCSCNGLVICSLPHVHALPFYSWRIHQFSGPVAVPRLAALTCSLWMYTDFPLNCSRATGWL